MRYHRIPEETIRRMPIYLRGIYSLYESGIERVSSKKLSDAVGISAVQIRKDFSYFGEFGVPGVGYDVTKLIAQTRKILKLDACNEMVLVGCGNLGTAVLSYPGFAQYGLKIVAAFDADTEKIGKKIGGVIVEDVADIGVITERRIRMGIIAVPEDKAQEIADKLVECGVRSILNFSPSHILTAKNVKVITIDIGLDLALLPYYVPGM